MKVKDNDFKYIVLDSDLPVLVDFWATWCQPCKNLSPIIDDISKKYDGKLRIVKLNVDDNFDITYKYKIRNVPTLILFRKGKKIAKRVGIATKSDLINWIAEKLP
jgi:thioredoxin 1